ncbi:CgeB family protein [Aneurinibacillus tyrosinisolvens]|uniref:CgeB family protein n=1 Tax=Aneurinibacillus tyrosinisolvens TaxID=1443435 RepID=UPI00063FCDF1|nr:glycosyltransferase [Aneurinibacillus tyrosinisolvens]
MNILFLDSSLIWLNCLPHGFTDLGHTVRASGPLTEENIPRIIDEFSPDLIVTVGWGPEHTIVKQNWIRKSVKAAGVPHIYWAVEDPHFTAAYTLPLLMRMQPDFVFTLSAEMVHFYRKLGIPSAQLDFGFHPTTHRKVKPEPEYESSLSLVANAYPHVLQEAPDHYRNQSLQTLIKPLLASKVSVNLWGRHWEQMEPILGEPIPSSWIKGYLHYTEVNQVYSASAIMLGLQNYQTQVTQRTYEILGSGGFLITSDTPAVRKLFKPGYELIVSSSTEETLDLIDYYLKNPDKREQIQKQGQLAAQIHSYKNRADYIIECLHHEGILKQ